MQVRHYIYASEAIHVWASEASHVMHVQHYMIYNKSGALHIMRMKHHTIARRASHAMQA